MNYKDKAQQLVGGGYSIVPIASGGKRPTAKAWQKTTFDADAVTAGVGVKCGIGDNPICAIDIDIVDGELSTLVADYARENFGVTVERVGLSPKILLVYQASQNGWGKFTSNKYGDDNYQIEVLGKGQQFVAYHIHPDTKKPYYYTGKVDELAMIPAQQLAVVTLEDITAIINYFEELCRARKLTNYGGGSLPNNGKLNDKPLNNHADIIPNFDDDFMSDVPLDIDKATIESCLKCITDNENRDIWYRVGASLHHQFRGSNEGLQLFNQWSSSASKYKGFDDVKKVWDSFHGKPNPLKASTLKYLAKQFNLQLYNQIVVKWNEPRAIVATLPPVLSVEPDMMPPVLFKYVADNAKRLNTPNEFVAIPLVVALASVVGTKVRVFPRMRADWEVVPNMWGLICGTPSSRKSPSLEAGTKPIENLVYLADKQYKEALKEHEYTKLIAKEKNSKADNKLKELAQQIANFDADADNGDTTLESLEREARGLLESKTDDGNGGGEPFMKRYIVDDTTPEKLGDLLNNHTNGLLLKRDELAGFWAKLDQPGNGEERNFYLECFNGKGKKAVDRIGRGSFIVENLCLSMIGTTQPDNMIKHLERTTKTLNNDGLLQRFQLMVYPDAIRGKSKDDYPDKEIRDEVYKMFENFDNMSDWDLIKYGANNPDDFTRYPYFRFRQDAYEHFSQWEDELQQKIYDAEDSGKNIIAEHLGKYPKTLTSLALLFHLVDCVQYGQNLGAISLPALKASIRFVEMLESHMRRIYSFVTDKPIIKASLLASRILDMIKKPNIDTANTPDDWLSFGFTTRQVYRKGWKHLTDPDDVQTAIDVLIEHDWLQWEQVPTTGMGGRTTDLYTINPKIRKFIN